MSKSLFLAGAALVLAAPLSAQMADHAGHAPPEPAKPPMVRANVADQVKAQFAKLDANKDGAVTRDEIAAQRAARRQEMQDRMFAEMDANKDGTISKDEFDAHHKDMAGHRRMLMDLADAPDAPDAPDMPDMPGMGNGPDRPDAPMPPPSGMMSKDGSRVVVIKRMRMGGPDAMMGGMMGDGAMFDMADANKDGKVTEAEALTSALARFDRMDRNKDGKITPDERPERRIDIRKVMKDLRQD